MSLLSFIAGLFRALSSKPAPVPVILPKDTAPMQPDQTHRFEVIDNRLADNNRVVKYVASPNVTKGRELMQRFILMHYTAGGFAGSLNTLTSANAKVSAHFLMDTDGDITQLVPLNRIAWHAGNSQTLSKWGTQHTDLNQFSIGIELVNYGYDGAHVPGSVDKSGWKTATHYKERSPRLWQPYTDEQWETSIALVAALCKAYGIPVENIKGHDEVSLSGKVDPGPLFDMKAFQAAVQQRMND